MKLIYQDIINRIHDSTSILLHLHPSPDGDVIGSTLAMYLYLKTLGKRVTLIKGDSELPQNFHHLPGFSEITSKTYFDLNLNEFDLFLIFDSASLSQISKLGSVSFPPHLFTIAIDHHSSNPKFARVNLVNNTVISVCEIIFDMFSKSKIPISSQMAINLFLGIYTDSGGFKYQKTTSQTFSAAAKLVKLCPDFHRYIFELENNADPGQILFKGLSLSSVKLFFNNHVAISAISYSTLKANSLSRRHSEKSEISNTLKSVIGWDIGVSIVEYEPGICSVSLRTRDPAKYDLGLIAQAAGTGGGHPAAAGATIYFPLDEAIQALLSAIQHFHPEMANS
ncbi:MAG: DHH family phosphoesterase [Candidatus Shapirobacteria bacterium]|jgi:phosphoesterase RecJ-like protein